MRPHSLWLAAAVAVLACAPAAAQDDGCTRADPCPWFVELDARGFVSLSQLNFTQGDWHVLSVGNADPEAAHSLTLDLPGGDVVVQVGPDGDADSAAFNFTQAGTFRLTTDHGHQATVRVVAADVVDLEQGIADESGNPRTGGASSKGTPDVAAPLAVAVLGAVAVALRRRPLA